MKIIVSLICFTVGFVLYVRYLEKISVFYPSRDFINSPQDFGLAFEDVYFQTQDGLRLNGWFFKIPTAKTTLLFFHGNAGNISDRLEKIVLFLRMGLNVFIVDYRGYGRSEGRPTEEGMYRDALAAYDYLIQRDDIDPKRIVAFGESLGGIAVIELATQRKLAAVVAESTLTSAKEIAHRLYPFIPSFLISLKMDSLSKVGTIEAPKLFLHSREDEMIPFEMGQKLFDAAAAPKGLVTLAGGHNDGFSASQEMFALGVKEFLEKYELL